MKKLYKTLFLSAFMLVCGALSAQILNYNFEQLNVGDRVAQTLGDPWTTWNNAPGTSEDAVVSDEQTEGTRSLKIDNGNDVVLKLGDKTTGVYRIAFDMYIPEGKEGYFNILHEFSQTSATNTNVWAFEMYLNSEAHGTLVSASSYISSHISIGGYDVPYNEWFNVEVFVSIDSKEIMVDINGHYVSYMCFTNCSLAALDLYPSNQTDESRNGFYIDNIVFEEWGTFTHNIVPQSESINAYIAHGDVDNISFVLNNEGNTFTRCATWIDYGIGGDGGEPKTMHYDTDPYYTYGNYYGDNNNPTPYIEIGALFNPNDIVSQGCIGAKVTKMQYFLPFSYPTAIVGCEGPITFRIYNYQTEEILAEKVLDEYYAGQWIEAVFDEPIPLTGFTCLATVGFQQIEGGYPISLDQGPSLQYIADLIRLDGGGWFSLNDNAQYYGQQDWGNHNIRVICEGEPIDASWVTHSFAPHLWINPGSYITLPIDFNAINADYGEYHATLVVVTNNDENPILSIPINMYVCGADVEENAENKYKLYPNPASDIIHIEGEDLNCAVIYDSAGKMVNVMQITNNSLNTSALTQGVYYVNIIDNKGGSSIQKVVIEK